MKILLLTICKRTFSIGFLIAGGALVIQAIEIASTKNAQGISLIAFIAFSLLHINGMFYSYFIAKDKVLFIGTMTNCIACIIIVVLKILYT